MLRFLIILLSIHSVLIAQSDHTLDSLKKTMAEQDFLKHISKVIEEQEKNTNDVTSLSLAYYYYGTHLLKKQKEPEQAKQVFDLGYKLAITHSDTSGLIRFKRGYGNYNVVKNQLETGIREYLEAISLAEKGNFTERLPHVYMEIAHPYYLLDNYSVSVEYLIKASEITEKPFLKASILNNIGILYKNNSDFDEAIDYYSKSLAISEEINDTLGAAPTLGNIGNVYLSMARYDSAFHYYNRAIQANPDNPTPNLLSNISRLMLASGQGVASKEINILNELYKQNQLNNNLKANLVIAETIHEYYASQQNYKLSNEYLLYYIETNKKLMSQTRIIETQKLKEAYEANKKQEKIELLTEKNKLVELTNSQNKILIIALLVVISLTLLTSILLIRNKTFKQEAHKLILEQQLLRSQMNPHFIFNSISNIQSFILNEENDLAVEYLGKFSTLARQSLEYSNEKSISLGNEIKMLENYLDLQKIRFNDKFIYSIEKDENAEDKLNIPPMLIQPFIENAIDHGLKSVTHQGVITIKLRKTKNFLRCEIIDNGIGRNNKKYSSYKKPMSTKITKERLAYLSRYTKEKPNLEIIDLKDSNNEPSGTHVIIDIPINHKV